MRALLTGWFSFEQMGATAGDLLARDLAAEWLAEAGCPYDVALAPPFGDQVNWREADPARYSHLVFVCGPIGNGPPVDALLKRFEGSTLIGLNLSMLHPLEEWNPFDLLWERNSSVDARPDITFMAREEKVPVVGVVRVDPQKEYGDRGRHEEANAAIDRLTDARPMAVVPIDTRLDNNRTGLRSAAEIETLIARMDVVVTTRLHGTVLALKNGVPALAIDPIAGGAKILRQAETIGWPICLTPKSLTDEALTEAFDFCLTEEARRRAVASRERAVEIVKTVRQQFIEAFVSGSS